MEVLHSSGIDPVQLDGRLEALRIILADAALVESAEEKQYQILEALRILGV